MNMEEFRKGLETESRKENESLKIEIQKLKTAQSEEERRLHHDLRALSNRCYALTHGAFCPFCKMMSKFGCERSLGKNN